MFIKYMTSIYSQPFIHHLTGLFRTNTVISCQFACQLRWQSTAQVSQRSWVQIPYRPEVFFFRRSFHYYLSSVHYCEDHFHIHDVSFGPLVRTSCESCPFFMIHCSTEARNHQKFIITSSNQLLYLHKFQTFDLIYTDTRYDFLPSFIADIIEKWNFVVVKIADFILIVIIIVIIIMIIFNLKRKKSSFVNPLLVYLYPFNYQNKHLFCTLHGNV